MNPEPSDDNQFAPPAAPIPAPPPLPAPELAEPSGMKPAKPHASLTLVLWAVWGLMFLSYPVIFMVVSLQPQPPNEPSWPLVKAFAVVAFLQLSLALFFRWLCFRYIISGTRLAPASLGAAGVGIFGGLVIFSQICGVGIYGFILFLQHHSWPCYLGFAVPSFLLFLFVMPALLLRFKK